MRDEVGHCEGDEHGDRDGHAEAVQPVDITAGHPQQGRSDDVLVDHAGHGDDEAARGRQERDERSGRDQGRQGVARPPGQGARRQSQHDGVGGGARGQRGDVDAAEDAVERQREVERGDQADHRDGRAPGRTPVTDRVVAHDDVGQGHRPERLAQQGRPDGVEGVGSSGIPAKRLGPGLEPLRGQVRPGGARADPHDEQHEGRQPQRRQLEPVVPGLDERDGAHAARAHDGEHHGADEHPTEPGGCAGEEAQREVRRLQLHEEIDPADDDHEQGHDPAHASTLEAVLGEVRQRVGPRPAQRGRDEDEQHEVADRVAHRQPQAVRAVGPQEPGHAEEAGGREVLAGDGGGVAPRRDRPRGDVEVARGAARAGAEQPEAERQQADRRHGDDAVCRLQGRRHDASPVDPPPVDSLTGGAASSRATARAKSRSTRSTAREYARPRTHRAG